MNPARPRPIGAHFIVAVMAGFIAVAAGLFARAAFVAADIHDARARLPIIVRVIEPADWQTVVKAAQILNTMDGVVDAEVMSPQRAAALMGRAGAALAPDDLPRLMMIEADIEQRLKTPQTTLRERLAKDGVLVEVDAPPPAPSPPLREAAWGAGALMVALALMLVWLAARAQAQVAAAAAIINADIGAPLPQTLASYGRAGASFGFRAGLAGALAGLVCVTIALISPRGGPKLMDLWSLTGRIELLIVFAGPLLIALAAASGARAGGAQAHRSAERLG